MRYHTEWWFFLKFDAFGSNVNVQEALEEFFRYKTLLFKEEGDTSHVNQRYDQQLTKRDKLETGSLINMVHNFAKSNIDQYMLVATLCMVLNQMCTANEY